jgi:IS30 family transposase
MIPNDPTHVVVVTVGNFPNRFNCLHSDLRTCSTKRLVDHLRSKRRMRRSRHSSEHGQSRGQIVDALSIRQRPAEVEDRAIPGHREGDLLAGGKNSYMATLVERHSRFARLIKVPSKETEAVVAALTQQVRKLRASLKTFADLGPRTNENTKLLLRQYFPKRTDLSGYTQADLDKVALRLNQRPRKTLGFQTPVSKLQQSVASTV